ncbi:hypothetical protein BX616_002194, partial [Lobosporangium transversale]
CLLSSAYLAPVYFMELYGSHIGISKQAAASINGWFNAASFVARVVSGVVADRISSSWCLLISTWLMVLSICVLWVLSKTYTVFLLFAIVYGFTFSGVSTVMPILVIEYYGAEKAASVLGTVYTMSSPALMLGTLVCGELLEMTRPHISYLPLMVFVGALFGVAGIFATAWVILVQRVERRRKPKQEPGTI